ncbi:MAG: gamma-glutamyl-gamma-aminobutyrate hydrolase family protein, partial [Actinomycetota bacterium]|nr:gamma-glutamyl-gamma-aminobutyrate hydrolase family protein [Actinomycetota bacterium]
MQRPLIGIPPCLDARERWRAGRVYVYADHAYARAIDAAGGLPVHLPMQSSHAELVARIDGLLLPGGDDFAPDRAYPDDVTFELAPDEQIAFDRALLDAALARPLPVLGICYGAQLIALAAGGRLHHHIPVDRPDAIDHQLPEADGRHLVALTPGSRLHACLADERGEAMVNSIHHQAVAELGGDLEATARSEDGLIEGFEAPGGFVVGVQWHPEKLDGLESSALFRAF